MRFLIISVGFVYFGKDTGVFSPCVLCLFSLLFLPCIRGMNLLLSPFHYDR